MRLATVILFFLCNWQISFAKEYTVDDIPKVRLYDKTKYVTDPENILSSYARSTIDSILYALEQSTGIETVVAVLPSIGSNECFDFTHELFEKWGVGKKGKDNGLVILLVTDQRCIQFETGYGLEGDLPDAICKRIQTQQMIPYLRDNNWDEGMIAGVRAVYNRLNGTGEYDDLAEEENLPITMIVLLFGMIGLYLIMAIYFSRKSKKCPVCKKYKLQRTNSRIIKDKNGIKKQETTYTCQNCGNKVIRITNIDDRNGPRSGGMSGPFMGGFFGGYGAGRMGRGGGFGGGSFGGGMTGGGGAGSRF